MGIPHLYLPPLSGLLKEPGLSPAGPFRFQTPVTTSGWLDAKISEEKEMELSISSLPRAVESAGPSSGNLRVLGKELKHIFLSLVLCDLSCGALWGHQHSAMLTPGTSVAVPEVGTVTDGESEEQRLDKVLDKAL